MNRCVSQSKPSNKIGNWRRLRLTAQKHLSQVVSDCSQVVPEKVEKKITGGVEPTLLLINLVKDLRMEELRTGKVRPILIIKPSTRFT